MRRRSGFGWLELAIGIILTALGILVFLKPDLALTGMVFAYGIAAVVMGIADIVLFIEFQRYTGFGPILALVSGVLSVMSGLMLVVYPGTGALVLTVLFPIWFIAHVVSRLTHLGHIRFVAGEGVYWFTPVCGRRGRVLVYPDCEPDRAVPGDSHGHFSPVHPVYHPLLCRCLPDSAGTGQCGDGGEQNGKPVVRRAFLHGAYGSSDHPG